MPAMKIFAPSSSTAVICRAGVAPAIAGAAAVGAAGVVPGTFGAVVAISVEFCGRAGVATGAAEPAGAAAFAVTAGCEAASAGFGASGVAISRLALPGVVTMASSLPVFLSVGTEIVAVSSETVALPSLLVAFSTS